MAGNNGNADQRFIVGDYGRRCNKKSGRDDSRCFRGEGSLTLKDVARDQVLKAISFPYQFGFSVLPDQHDRR
jgi:hypothetical protein